MDETKSQNPASILRMAWQQYADLNKSARILRKRHLALRWWVATLGVLATLFAILTDNYSEAIRENFKIGGLSFGSTVALLLYILLILSPIAASIVAYIAKGFGGGGNWLVMRAGAEQTMREIYIFRTILADNPKRRDWLNERLADIQRSLFKALGGELVLTQYKGSLPPYHSSGDLRSDEGFANLDGDNYLKYRLDDQLDWHRGRLVQHQYERTRLQIFILAMGGLGALLAAVGEGWAVWVAFTAALGSAFSGWDQLRNLDDTVRNYSKVILELNIARNTWINLEPVERTLSEFHRMVRSVEEVLWAQNAEYIRSMQEALASVDDDDDLVMETVRASQKADAAFKTKLRSRIVDQASETMDEVFDSAEESFDDIVGSISEFASEEVREEMQGLRDALSIVMQSAVHKMDRIAAQVREEFADEEFNENTAVARVNAQLQKFPPQGDGIG